MQTSVFLLVLLTLTMWRNVISLRVHTEGLPRRNYYRPGDLDIGYIFGMSAPGTGDTMCSDNAENWTYPFLEAVK